MNLQKSVILAGGLMLVSAISSNQTRAEQATPQQAVRYQFSALELSSADSRARYLVRVGIPHHSRPSTGYAVLYMLDGEAALAALKEQNFSGLAEDDWPVIVTLGHKGVPRTPQVQAARAYDYTPVVFDNSAEPQYGGAEVFGQFIEREVKPAVAQQVTVDSERQTLWGHSFGGLFVLHTLFNHPASFQNYIAADPSLWWQ